MKSHTKYLWFNTQKRREYINITKEVEEAVRESGVREGMALVSAMHITAGVYVNDAEPGIIQDIDEMLEKVAPFGKTYRHPQTGEDNGDAHLKSILVHHQVIVPITNGKLDLGPWQQIYYAEFDGRRRRTVTQLDVSPFIKDGKRVMVPVRFVAEELGYRVEYNEASNTVLIYSK